MKDSEKKYSRKDIIKVLRDIYHDISENIGHYGGLDRHIYRKACDDAMKKIYRYIETDNDKPESYIKRYTKESIYKQVEYSEFDIYHLIKEYSGEDKEVYSQGITDAVAILKSYKEKYR